MLNKKEIINNSENKPKKPLVQKLKILFMILSVPIILFLLWSFIRPPIVNTSNSNPNYNNPINNPIVNCHDEQVPYDYLEEYQETVPYTDRECETKELAYSITNFIINTNICNQQEYICKDEKWWGCAEKEYYCVDKSISCALNLKNLDAEEKGTWQITFNYLDQNTRNIIKSETKSEFLYPQTEKTFISAVRLTSTGIEGDANKDITCAYQAINVPTKQVCRDVTKYREITKTRTVTRYKTEKVCN